MRHGRDSDPRCCRSRCSPQPESGRPRVKPPSLPIRRNTLLRSAALAANSGMLLLSAAETSLTLVLVVDLEGLLGLGPAIVLASSALEALPAGRLMDRIGRVPEVGACDEVFRTGWIEGNSSAPEVSRPTWRASSSASSLARRSRLSGSGSGTMPGSTSASHTTPPSSRCSQSPLPNRSELAVHAMGMRTKETPASLASPRKDD